MVRLGVPTGELTERRTAFMRYRGQGHEIAVPLDRRGARSRRRCDRRSRPTYARLFGRIIPRLEIEAVTWTLALSQPYALPCRRSATSRRRDPRRHERHPPHWSNPLTGETDRRAGLRPRLPVPRRRPRRPSRDHRGRHHHHHPHRLHRPHRRTAAKSSSRERQHERPAATSAEIDVQIMWNRLLSVVEEQGQTLVRTAFSTSAREAGDISAGVFDLRGRMLAQAVTGTPGHINTMAASVGHFLEVFPVADMKEGDVYITNDPWKGTGHLYDLVVVSPTFMDGRIVALFACTVASGRHGRRRPDARGPPDLARGPVHPAAAPGSRRRDERRPAGDDPRQCARAGAGDRRRLRADRLQRDRQPPAGRDDARIRPRRPRQAGRGNHHAAAAAR